MILSGLSTTTILTISPGKALVTSVQLSWTYLIVSILSGMAAITEPPGEKLINKPPVQKTEPLITKAMRRNIMAQVFNQFNSREIEKLNVFKNIDQNYWFRVATSGPLALQIASVEISGIIKVSQSQPTSHTLILNDIEEAITDITSQNFFEFALLLQMLKGAIVHKYQDSTFLVPIDQELTKHSISTGHLQEFLLNNSIPMPLSLSDLTHFPTGTLVPAGLDH
ncbi:hypothetical protein SADUNF_Sadunf16G0013500 [Salix dunnii]|uniref:Cation-transporting P-type ATPase C-terminal domain-containing protein n=1 Tax=Salix dunnii TaxID=1413687 RepID=A0A835J997_9ROSI|nr:hypothetical protein SADUNF_Sadunf16G0013500 [Salix dunnii]